MPPELEVLGKPVENCGIVGIIDLSGREAVHRAAAMLGKQVTRGQDAAGIATKNHGFHLHRAMGLAPKIFTREAIVEHNLEGSLVIGHTRYRIQGGDTMDFTQPILASNGQCEIAVAHNGNIEDLGLMKERLARKGIERLTPDYDSNYLAHVLAFAPGKNYIEKIQNGLRGVVGSYSLVVATHDGHLIGVRDPWGNRPLSLTQADDFWAIASETSAFQALRATDRSKWHEFNPGEIIDISAKGAFRSKLLEKTEPRVCVFERIYLGYDTSVVDGETNGTFRRRLGRMLARNHPGSGEVVTAVPESSRSAALAYSHASGKEGEELVKKAVGSMERTFIAGEMNARRRLIEGKFDVSPAVNGRRIDVLEDSYVCGNTAQILFETMVDDYGALPPDALSTAPKVIADCRTGVSMRSGDGEFLAIDPETGRVRTDPEMAEKIGARSIAFLSVEELQETIREGGKNPDSYCYECFGGQGFGPLTLRRDRPMTKEFVWPNP